MLSMVGLPKVERFWKWSLIIRRVHDLAEEEERAGSDSCEESCNFPPRHCDIQHLKQCELIKKMLCKQLMLLLRLLP